LLAWRATAGIQVQRRAHMRIATAGRHKGALKAQGSPQVLILVCLKAAYLILAGVKASDRNGPSDCSKLADEEPYAHTYTHTHTHTHTHSGYPKAAPSRFSSDRAMTSFLVAFFLGGGVVKQADVELPGGYPKAPPMWRLKMQQVLLDVCLCVCLCVCVFARMCVSG
jgi:hypothetical protein